MSGFPVSQGTASATSQLQHDASGTPGGVLTAEDSAAQAADAAVYALLQRLTGAALLSAMHSPQFGAQLPHLRTLVLSGRQLDGPAAASAVLSPVLGHAPGLLTLDLSDNPHLGAAGMQAVALVLPSVPNLEQLLLRGTGMGPGGATALAASLPHLPALRLLDVSDNGLGRSGLDALLPGLASAPKLQALKAEGNGFGPDAAPTLSALLTHSLPHLRGLWLGHSPLGEKGVQAIAQALPHTPRLRILDLSDVGAGRFGIVSLAEVLPQLPELEQLLVSSNACGDAAGQHIAHCVSSLPQLKVLDVRDNNISHSAQTAIADAAHTRSADIWLLGVRGSDGIDTGAAEAADESFEAAIAPYRQGPDELDPAKAQAAFAALTRPPLAAHHWDDLRVFDATGSRLWLGGAGAPLHELLAEGVPRLEALLLGDCNISPEHMRPLLFSAANLRHLRRLALSGNDLSGVDTTAALVHSLSRLQPHLTELDLRATRLGPSGVAGVAHVLGGGGGGFKGWIERVEHAVVPHMVAIGAHNLVVLDLTGNDAGPAGFAALAVALPAMTSLRHLRVSSNKAGPGGMLELASALPHSPQLEELRVGANRMGPDAARSFALSLVHLPRLESLGLGTNAIGPAGAEVVGASLAFLPKLTALGLSHNALGPEGAQQLIAALHRAPQLIALDLSSNGIDDISASALCRLLSAGGAPGLQGLRLSGNPLSHEAAAALLALARPGGLEVEV